MDFARYRRHDVISRAAEVAAGHIDPEALLDLALARLAAVQSTLNPVCRPMEGQARASLANGRGNGPLTGVPWLIKDAGLHTSAGIRAFAALAPASPHAHAVKRVLDAGAAIFGKTNTPELALKGIPTACYGLVGFKPSRGRFS